jgi:hypothetical protein
MKPESGICSKKKLARPRDSSTATSIHLRVNPDFVSLLRGSQVAGTVVDQLLHQGYLLGPRYCDASPPQERGYNCLCTAAGQTNTCALDTSQGHHQANANRNNKTGRKTITHHRAWRVAGKFRSALDTLFVGYTDLVHFLRESASASLHLVSTNIGYRYG